MPVWQPASPRLRQRWWENPTAGSSKRQLRFGRKGSLAVTTAGPKTGSWYDHENGVGGDLFSLIRRNRGGGFLDALAYAERIIGRRPTQPESPATVACRDQAEDCSAWNRRRAGELWQEAVPITATVASRYLATRRLYPIVDSEGRVLRFHPSCRYDTTRHPCLLALMRDVRTDEPRAIQRTALTQTGEKIGRMTLGPKTGSAIKLSGILTAGHVAAAYEKLPEVGLIRFVAGQAAERSNVDTVIIGGRVRKHRGQVVGLDMVRLKAMVDEPRGHLFTAVGYRPDIFAELLPKLS
jgi:hypothetical protein